MYMTQVLDNAALPILFAIQQEEKYLSLTIQLPLFKK